MSIRIATDDHLWLLAMLERLEQVATKYGYELPVKELNAAHAAGREPVPQWVGPAGPEDLFCNWLKWQRLRMTDLSVVQQWKIELENMAARYSTGVAELLRAVDCQTRYIDWTLSGPASQ